MTPACKPLGLGFNQCRLTHTRLALTTQTLSVRSYVAFSYHATLPPLFRDSSHSGRDKVGTHGLFQQAQYLSIRSLSAADAAHHLVADLIRRVRAAAQDKENDHEC